jgi:hypothetical protein
MQGKDTNPADVQKIRDAISKGEMLSIRILNYKKNGEAFWNYITLAPIKVGERVVKYIRSIPKVSGTGSKHVLSEEVPILEKLRRVKDF